MPGSVAAAGSSFHWNYSPVQHSRLLWKSLCREGKPRNTDPSGSTSCSTWQEKCSGKKKAHFQSCSFCCCFTSSEPLLPCSRRKWKSRRNSTKKKDDASLFSRVKRKYLFTDIYKQVMAGGKWPWRQKCAMVITGEPGPSPLTIKKAQLRATLQIISGNFNLICLCFGVFVVSLNFWRMDNAVLLSPALVILDVSLKAWVLKAYKTKIFIFLKLFHMYF